MVQVGVRALFSLNRLDSILMEGDHKVSVHQLTVQLNQVLVGFFIPVFSFAPRLPEVLLTLTVRAIDLEVLINGPPCTIQSACDPAVD